MKRRNFLAGLGFTAPGVFIDPKKLLAADRREAFNYHYPDPEDLVDLTDDLGRVAVYIKFSGAIGWIKESVEALRVADGRENDRKQYFFASGETLYNDSTVSRELPTEVVTVVWLDEFAPDTTVGTPAYSFSLDELLQQQEWQYRQDAKTVTAYLLGQHEIGEIDPEEFLKGPSTNAESYTFAIMADPQGGDPTHEKYVGTSTRMHIHNAFTEDTIRRINELEDRPVFTLVLGDYTDHQGEKAHFEVMDRIFRELNTPVLLEIGNHETRYAAEFGPGYNMSAFDNYFAAQERLNGMEKLLYSFNLSNYHYIVWPDPLRSGFWETHPHYFDWLERDLEKYKDRPTIFFQHVPVHPIGIDPLVHYAEKPYIKRLLLDLLTRHGNVRYVFSGHVHIPIKSSRKTAVTYKGINFINLPAAGYRPRAFGEPDYYGGPCQGAAIVEVSGDEVQVNYLDVTRNVYTYPATFEEAPLEAKSLLTLNKWDLAEGQKLRNGDFSGLDHWHGNYIYREDESPTYYREVQRIDGANALYLRANKRKYDKPGQDRLPQTLNQLTQVMTAPAGKFDEIELQMQVDCEKYFDKALLGAFVWIEGYWGHHKQYSLIYSAGHIPQKLGNRFNRSPRTVSLHRHLPLTPGHWHTVALNPAGDLESIDQPVDRWAVNLGVWNINDGNNDGIGAYFRDVRQRPAGNEASRVDGNALEEKPEEKIYVFRVDHTAGEHVIADQEALYFYDF